MRVISRLIVMAGAFLGSVCQSDRPYPGGYIHLVHQGMHQSLSPLRVTASASAPIFKVGPFGTVSRLARSKSRVGRKRSMVEILTPTAPVIRYSHLPIQSPAGSQYANRTAQSPQLVVLGAENYDGPKEIFLLDARRELMIYRLDGSQDLALYNRPNSLALYTAPIDFIQFWVDNRHYQVVAQVYRPRFTDSAPMSTQYGHLEPRDFERWAYQAAEDPVEIMLASERSTLREVFGLVSHKYPTIGEFKRRSEEQASRVIARICVLGFLVSLMLMAGEEYLELVKATAGLGRPMDFVETPCSEFVAASDLCSPVQLEETKGADKWWEAGTERKQDSRINSATTYVDTSLSGSVPSRHTPTSDLVTPPIPAQVLQAPGSSRSPTKPTLAQRPSGPRFKSAAWKRCRAK